MDVTTYYQTQSYQMQPAYARQNKHQDIAYIYTGLGYDA